MHPTYTINLIHRVYTKRSLTDSNDTVEVVILATEGLSIARVGTGTDDGDRGTSDTDEDVSVLDYYSEGLEESGNCGGACCSGGVATLDGAGVALGCGLVGIGAVEWLVCDN